VLEVDTLESHDDKGSGPMQGGVQAVVVLWEIKMVRRGSSV
jgi:hypothetical protein